MAGVCRIQGLLNDILQVGWVRITVRPKNPSSSRDLGRLERAEIDLGTNAIKLGLAVGGKEFLSQVKTQEDRNKKGRESISGEPETIKILPKLGESVPQSGAKFKNFSFVREGETIGKKGDGAIHLEKLIQVACQRVAVTPHMIQPHGFGIGDDHVKVE